MQLSIYEILNKASRISAKSEKVQWLKQNNLKAVKTVLKAMYDPELVSLLPEGVPPYTPSQLHDDVGMLIGNSRKIPYFYPSAGSNLSDMKREQVFVELLETVNKNDALLLIDMKDKKRIKGLTVSVINEAYPNLISTTKEKN
jgi:hypothetical protein